MNETVLAAVDLVDDPFVESDAMVVNGPQDKDSILLTPDELKLLVEEMDLSTTVKQEPVERADADCGMSQIAINVKKKKGSTGKSLEEELCLICGDRASGYHYNALSCEGCKGFFRRSITRNATYHCKNGGNCEMDMWMRRRCQYCRLRRCREVGMKEECLLSDEQCKARDVRRKSRTKKCSSVSSESPKGSPGPVNGIGTPTMTPSPPAYIKPAKPTKPTNPQLSPDKVLGLLTSEERALIEKLVTFQDQYELPSDDDVRMLTTVKVESLGKMSMSDAVFQQMAGMTILVTHLVVEFSKRLPGFLQLEKDDQIALLKGSACEVMMIRTSRRYDVESDTIIFADGSPYTRESLRFGGLHDYVDCMFQFCRGMGLMHVDNAEYALLTAICIFSERPGLLEIKKVECIQEMYITALENYIKIRRPEETTYFARMLMKLTELRTLSVHYEKVLENMKVEHGPLPPLLREYFDQKQ